MKVHHTLVAMFCTHESSHCSKGLSVPSGRQTLQTSRVNVFSTYAPSHCPNTNVVIKKTPVSLFIFLAGRKLRATLKMGSLHT